MFKALEQGVSLFFIFVVSKTISKFHEFHCEIATRFLAKKIVQNDS
jgi:hypothetical protein